MEQYTERHYDDDLTIGADDYDDSFQTPDIDLFEYAGADDSPIARLKSLVLSIDWEITDEVLLQFNEELLDLKDVWAGDQIRQVYLQALEKISKYIYREKADANPNSIKLLLALYYNLEKIVSSSEITEEEKKQLLLEDVRNFEKLKHQIKKMTRGQKGKGNMAGQLAKASPGDPGTPARPNALTTLKAIILGIDWEITEKELLALQQEVGRLHEVFLASRPKLIFLQGIGTLGAYIRNKKSNAHADAFKLLHSFFAGLEQIVNTPLSLAEEKAILLPEVAKFNAFKELISASLATESLRSEDEEEDDDDKWGGRADIQPAFADIPGETKGFQEEEAAAALGLSGNIESNIEKFFGVDQDLPSQGGELVRPLWQQASQTADVSLETSPVAAEPAFVSFSGQDADEDADEKSTAGTSAEPAPALADEDDYWHAKSEISGPATTAEDAVADELMTRLDDFFAQEATSDDSRIHPLPSSQGEGSLSVPAEIALQGVDVETEGDDLEGADEVAAAVAEKSADWQPLPPVFESAADQVLPWPEAEAPPAVLGGQEGPGSDEDLALAETEDVPEVMADSAMAELLADEGTVVEEVVETTDGWQYPAETSDTCDVVGSLLDHPQTMAVDEDLLLERYDLPETSSQSAFESALTAAEPGSWVDRTVDIASDDQVEQVLTFADSIVEATVDSEPITVEAAQLDDSIHDDFEAIADLTPDDVDFILRATAENEEPLAPIVQDGMVMFADHLPEAEPQGEYSGSAAVVAEDNDNGFGFDHLTVGWADEGVLDSPSKERDALSGDEASARTAFAASDEYPAVFSGAVDNGKQTDVPYGEEDAADDADCAVLAGAGKALSAVSSPTNTDIAALLDGLGETIALLGRQSGDDAVQLLFRYINCLRQKWVGQPLAKIYLQLLSSVAQHIERRGDKADAGAQDLLRTVFRYLRGSWKNFNLGQDQLLCATCKVLQWQHDMMMRPTVLPGVTSQVQETDTEAEPSPGTADVILGATGTDRIGCAIALPETEELSSAVLRRELDFLRHALQDELAELRSALKTNPK